MLEKSQDVLWLITTLCCKCFILEIDGRKTVEKVPWSSEENAAIIASFKLNINGRKVPGKAEVEHAMEKYSVLRQRKWSTIKAKVANMIKKN